MPGALSWILAARLEGPRVGESFSSSLLASFGRRYVESVKADEFDVTDMVDACDRAVDGVTDERICCAYAFFCCKGVTSGSSW